MESLRSIHHSVRDKLAVEGCQLSTMSHGQSQQIAVGYLRGVQKPCDMNVPTIHEGDAVRPELMRRVSQESRH